ncbi:MAG: pyrroline-5-carboxylate reductase [Alkalinema sp. RU_4_3]|nr:pyrroline-5-carboxylate reductase [Alkalinema sp. RU_4_3]
MAAIAFGMIGGGVMGEALLSRLIEQQVYAPSSVMVSDPMPERRQYLEAQYGIQVTDNNLEAATASEVLFLAIKPQVFGTVATQLKGEGSTKALVLSILAGTTLEQLEAGFPDRPVVRVMPNTPAAVGAGVSALSGGKLATVEHLAQARKILGTVGQVVEVPEHLMDAVTGLSGSGPGYVAIVIEALADGGVLSGLPRGVAMELAIQTVLGTATLIREKGMHPGQLKDLVTSPGGTTIAGVAKLESLGLRTALIEAVKAATDRSMELGK